MLGIIDMMKGDMVTMTIIGKHKLPPPPLHVLWQRLGSLQNIINTTTC